MATLWLQPEGIANLARIFFVLGQYRFAVALHPACSDDATMSLEIEEGRRLQLDFAKLLKVAKTGAEVVPVVAQDADTGEVIIVAYANQLALEHTLSEGKATFWSTSRNELWIKGATSGDYLELIEVRVNCEQNSLLYLVRLAGAGSCHTKDASGKARHGCYYRRVNPDGTLDFLESSR